MDRNFTNVNDELVVLEDDQLLEYIKCPNLFYLKYVSHISIKEDISFRSLVLEVINGYLSRLMEGKLPSIKKAKKMWDRQCEENPAVITDKKVLEGFGMINLFDKYCYNNKLVIADFGSPYEFTVSNVKIKGNLGALRLNNDVLELFFIETGQLRPNQQLLDMSLRYTLQCYAIEKLSSSYKVNCIRVLHLKTGEEFTTYRTKKDYERLERIIANIGKSIRAEIYYPREDFTCPQCKGKNYCGYI